MAHLRSVEPTEDPGRDDLRLALERVLREPELITPHFQPIVDLSRGAVAGFEMLARFDLPGGHRLAEWFIAAARHGLVADLDAVMMRAAVGRLGALPPNTFLTVNVTSDGATSEVVHSVLREAGSIGGLVVELTEQTTTEDPGPLVEFSALVRSLGGMVAVDDIGTGYSSMQRVMAIRPEFLKIDRSFVASLHGDEAKVAVVEMMGSLGNRIDAWVIAEGVEQFPELDRLLRIGVPLGQGYLFSRPTAEINPQVEGAVKRHLTRDLSAPSSCEVAPLVDRVDPVVHPASVEEVDRRFEADFALDYLPALDARARPEVLIRRSRAIDQKRWRASPMTVHPGAKLSHVARRAMTRSRVERFTPLIYCNEQGQYVGILRIEQLLETLAGEG